MMQIFQLNFEAKHFLCENSCNLEIPLRAIPDQVDLKTT